jgi:hypothetical protein
MQNPAPGACERPNTPGIAPIRTEMHTEIHTEMPSDG